MKTQMREIDDVIDNLGLIHKGRTREALEHILCLLSDREFKRIQEIVCTESRIISADR
jgi:hypothetical protein